MATTISKNEKQQDAKTQCSIVNETDEDDLVDLRRDFRRGRNRSITAQLVTNDYDDVIFYQYSCKAPR
jgi:hypothetical protein